MKKRCKKPISKKRLAVYGLLAVVFWLLFWEGMARRLDQPLFLPHPKAVALRFFEEVQTGRFWSILWFSLCRIGKGFFFALIGGSVLAVLASFSVFLRMLLAPAMKLIKTVPVVSFIIVLLLWVKSSEISVVISFLIVVPVVYANVCKGIEETGRELLEMARVFRLGRFQTFRYLYVSSVMPYFVSACQTGLGLCWKAGIAAEVIGLAADSVGRQMYDAKLYLDTEGLFCWTAAVIAVSVVFEKAVMILIRLLEGVLTGGTSVGRLFGFALQENGKLSEEKKADKPVAPVVSNVPGAARQGVAIVLQDVQKSYGVQQVLSGVSCEMKAGETVCFRGPSGCGKTTLLRLVLGLEQPEAGKIFFDGKEEAALSAVFQEDRLCEAFSALANVKMAAGGRWSDEALKEELRAVGIEAWQRKVRDLSGGMRRRVAIVRAMVSDSRAVVLDEPFNGLDEARKQQVISYIKARTAGRTVLMVTHDRSEAKAMGARTETLKMNENSDN